MDKLSTGAILTELRKRNADPENKRLHLAAFLLEEPHHVIPQKVLPEKIFAHIT